MNMHQAFSENREIFNNVKECSGHEDKFAFQANLLSSVHDAIMAVDENLIITFWNQQAEKIIGWAASDVIGKPANDLYQTLNINLSIEEMAMHLNTYGYFTGELAVHKKDGNRIYTDVHIKKGFRRYGEYNGVVASFRDITERKQQEEKLTFQANLLSSVHDAIIAVDENLIVTYWNEVAEKTSGWSAAEVIGQSGRELFIKSCINASLDEIITKLSTDGYYTGELSAVLKDGSLIYSDTHMKRIIGQQGEFNGVVISLRDITERIRSEKELRESESMLRTILENSRDGINLLDVATGKYVYMSPTQVEMTGFSAEEMNNISADDADARLHPDDREIATDMHKQVAAGMEASFEAEYRWKVKSGEYRWFSDMRKLIRNELGQPISMVGISRDITNRKIQEEQLLFHAKVLANVHDAIFAVNENYIITYWGGEAEKIMGWTAHEAIGRPFFEIMKPAFLDPETSCEQEFAKMFKQNKYNNEFICHSKDGVEIYISAHTSIIRDKTGNIKEIITSFRDITEQKEAEAALREKEEQARALAEELKKADKNKNDFIGVLSHELRNPLATIVTGLSLIDISNDKELKSKTRETINRQIDQLCKLVDDLLDLTRLTQKRIKLKKEYININQIVTNTIDDMRPEFEKKGVQLGFRIRTQPTYLEADPVRITQAIGNILFNALKFTHKDGVVWLTLKRERNEAVISIKDNGIGISAEVLSKLFQPFTQADNTLGRRNNGLGLGLSIVKGIIDLHDGKVSASSKGLGFGSNL